MPYLGEWRGHADVRSGTGGVERLRWGRARPGCWDLLIG